MSSTVMASTVRCPQCGSLNVKKVATIDPSWAAGASRCRGCGYQAHWTAFSRIPPGGTSDPEASAESLEGLIPWLRALREATEGALDPNELTATRNILLQKLSGTPAPEAAKVVVGMILGALRATPAPALTSRMVSRIEALVRWVFSGAAETFDVEGVRRELAEAGFPQASETALGNLPVERPVFVALMGGEGVTQVVDPSASMTLEEEIAALKAEALRQREAWTRIVEIFEQNAAVLRKALRDRGVDPDVLLQAAFPDRGSATVEALQGKSGS